MNQSVKQCIPRGLDGFSDDAFIRLKQLKGLYVIPYSESTYWRKVKQGKFPRPVKISEKITATRVKDIRKWAKDPAGYQAPADITQYDKEGV